MARLSSDELRVLSAELAQLTKAQEDALKVAVYFPMNFEEVQAYEKRRIRINDLREMLAQAKAS
jgi:hypothetical protein